MTLKFTRLETATAVVAALQAGAALFVLTMGSTDLVPMHFGIDGSVDRWGDRNEAGLVIGVLAAVTLLGGLGLARSARKADASHRKSLAVGQVIILATTSLLTGMMVTLASDSLDPAVAGPRVIVMTVCAVFAAIGALLGRVPQNRLVGVRTPWGRRSRLAWEKSNRLAGRLFFWAGLIGLLIVPALPIAVAHGGLMATALSIAALSVFESWRVWRTDPERTA